MTEFAKWWLVTLAIVAAVALTQALVVIWRAPDPWERETAPAHDRRLRRSHALLIVLVVVTVVGLVGIAVERA